MNRERRILLWSLVSVFALVAGVIPWNELHDRRAFFPAGDPPAQEADKRPEPRLPPIRSGDPVRGSVDPNAVQIVVFDDYTCLYCRLMEGELRQALSDSDVPAKIIWRDYVVNTDRPESTLSALAARCALDQGKFWEMHDALMSAARISADSIKKIAQSTVGNQEQFESCLTTGKYLASLQNDVLLAKAHGITGAPTVFVGSKVFDGYVSSAEILSALRRAKR